MTKPTPTETSEQNVYDSAAHFGFVELSGKELREFLKTWNAACDAWNTALEIRAIKVKV